MQITASFLSGLTTALQSISSNEQQLTNEISSGVRVNEPVDDPVATGENIALSAGIGQDDSFHSAASTVTGMLQVTDSTLGSVVTQLTQAISVATAGDNGTNNSTNQSSVATQLSGIRDELLSLANTSYAGSYLFAGTRSNSAPFSLDSSTNPAAVTYLGDGLQSTLTSPLGSTIPLNIPGSQIFSNPSGDVFGTLNQLISDFSSGNLAAAQTTTASLNEALSNVSLQRARLDNSITRISNQDTILQGQATQLITQQTSLMQADTASVATQLSSSETQQAALQDTIAALEKQGNLFSQLSD